MYKKGYQRGEGLEIKRIIFRHMSKLRPETGETIAIFKIINQILFILSPFLLFYLMYEKRLPKATYLRLS